MRERDLQKKMKGKKAKEKRQKGMTKNIIRKDDKMGNGKKKGGWQEIKQERMTKLFR